MKLSFRTSVYCPCSFPILLNSSAFSNLCRPICSLAPQSPPIALKPQIPLFLRPPIYSTKLCDLKKWQDWAKNVAFSVGSTFVESDNGPDSSILCRELKWLMEDAVVEEPSLDDDERVRMRAGIEELYCLWKERIQERRPFQYIVGCEHWRDLVLSVQEGVLIPRPETEHVVDMVSGVVSKNEDLRGGVWADLGTGSGALAIGIGRILGDRGRVIATDLSPVAVAVAAYNVKRYCLQDKIEIREGSWFEPLKGVEGGLAGLVSNPPYIPSKEISGLQAEVGRHEPRLALDGGTNGMEALLHLCDGAALMLKPGGFFAVELKHAIRNCTTEAALLIGMEMDLSIEDVPIRVITSRTSTASGITAEQWLIKRKEGFEEDATSEDEVLLQSQFPDFSLVDTQASAKVLELTNGEQQCRDLVEYMENNRSGTFCDVEIHADFAGIKRFVIGFHQ